MTHPDEAKNLVAEAYQNCEHPMPDGGICSRCVESLVTRLLADNERLTEACEAVIHALEVLPVWKLPVLTWLVKRKRISELPSRKRADHENPT